MLLELSKSNNGVVIDLGCGEAPHQELLSKHFKEYIPVDIPGNPIATHFVDLKTNMTSLDSSKADAIWSIQVLEHVNDYDAYLKEANRLLKSGGMIVASTHGQWKYHPDPIDFWRWTSAGLKETFERSGFEVTSFSGSMSFLTTTLQLFQDAILLSFPLKKFWGPPFCLLMQLIMLSTEWFSKQSKTLNQHRNLDSDVYFIVARKLD